MSTNQDAFDVVIAGGGTTGICLALSLLKFTQLRIAIIESHNPSNQQNHPGFDSRSVALASHSVELLMQIGLTTMTEIGCPIKHIHVSDKGHLGQCRMHASDYNVDALGQVVELSALGQALFELVEKADKTRLCWLRPDAVVDLQQTQGLVRINTKEGECITAKLLVIAEGGNSPTREKLGLPVKHQHYGQVALIANVETSKPHESWAFERFTQSGPLAMLPHTDKYAEQGRGVCSLVWTLEQSQSDSMLALSDSDFIDALQNEFGYRLGKLMRVGKRELYPLVLTYAEELTSHRVVVIGNAAQALHPIAGQGLNLALRDIQCLSETLESNSLDSGDPGSFETLREYAQKRKADRQAVIGMTDALVRIFSNDYLPFVIGRNIGLSALNIMPAAKSMLANQAMGRILAKRSFFSATSHKER